MQNDEGQIVDILIPRKCYATNRILDAKDHSSVQITVSTVKINSKKGKSRPIVQR